MRIRVLHVVSAMLVLAVVAVAVLVAWLASEPALRWIVDQAVQRSGGQVVVEGARGTLADRVQFDRIVYSDEGMRVTVTDVSADPALRSLLRRQLHVRELSIGRIVVEQTASDEKPASPPDSLEIPIDVVIDRARVGAIDWRSGEQTFTFEALALAYEGRDGEHRVADFGVRGPGGTLEGGATIGMHRPYSTYAWLVLDLMAPNPAGHVDAEVTGTFDRLVASGRATIAGIAADASVTVAPFAAQPIVAGHVDAHDVDLSTLREGLPGTRLRVTIDAKPSPGGFAGHARAVNAIAGPVDADRVPLASASTDFALDGVRLDLRNVVAALPGGGSVAGSGTIDIDSFRNTWKLAIERLDLAQIHSSLVATNLAGRIEADVTADVQRVTGDVSQDELRLAFDARYDGKSVVAERLLAQARNGTLEGSARIALEGERPFSADLRASNFDPSRFGDFPGGTLNGTIVASGNASDTPFAKADVTIAPGSRLGGLALQGRVRGRFAQAFVQDVSANASIGATNVRATGAFGRPGDRMTVDVAAKRLGELHALLPDTIEPLAGSVDASLVFETLAQGGRLTIDARGDGLRYGEQRVQALAVKGRATHAAPLARLQPDVLSDVSLVVEARDVVAPDTVLERMRVALEGSLASHTINASVRREGIDVDGRVVASLADFHSPSWRWRGRIEALTATGIPAVDRVTLVSPAAFAIGADDVAFEAFRVTGNGAVLDVEQIRYAAGALDTRGRFSSLPVAPFVGLAELGDRFTTDLTLRGSWDVVSQRGWRGRIDIARESGDLNVGDPASTNGSRVSLGITALAIDATIDGARLADTAELKAGLGTFASSTFALDGPTGALHPFDDASRIKAAVRAQLPSLAALQPWIGTNARVQGRASADVTVTGTMASPRFDGQVLGENLRVDMPQHGVALRDGRLRIASGPKGLALDELAFTAGEGHFNASGVIGLPGSGQATRIAWQAQNFRALNRPDRRLVVDGDGTLAFEGGRVVLRGKLSADEGNVEYRATDDTKLADDIVVVGRPRPTRTTDTAAAPPVDLDLEIALGRNFRISAEGLEARLAGRVQVASRGGGPVTAKGTIRTVDGTYYAFGQKLDIDRGRVIFAGPVNNPSLDIVALRKNLAVEAGVEISGTVRAPLVRLTSNPPVPDNEKLAWLITGGPPGNESAQQSAALAVAAAALTGPNNKPFTQKLAQRVGLDDISLAQRGSAATSDPLAGRVVSLGKRISDKLYVAYEQGLSLASNALRLEYVLTRYLTVAAFAGTQSGIALNFRRTWR